MAQKVITPDNEVTNLVSKLQTEKAKLTKQVMNLKEKVLDLKAKNLKLSQKIAMLEAKSKKSKPIDLPTSFDLSEYMADNTNQPTPREYAGAVEAAFKKDKP